MVLKIRHDVRAVNISEKIVVAVSSTTFVNDAQMELKPNRSDLCVYSI